MEDMNQEQLILPSATLTIPQVPRPSHHMDLQKNPKNKNQQNTQNQALCHVINNLGETSKTSIPYSSPKSLILYFLSWTLLTS